MALGTINTNQIASEAVTVPKVTDQVLSSRNLIINGAMQVAQRGTSTTGVTGIGYQAVDRWEIAINTTGTHTVSQDTDAPDGFSYSSKILCTVADASLVTSDYLTHRQKLEGQNVQHLQYGTSNAKTVTASFWVKSNVTGTYTLSLEQESPAGYFNVHTYTINTADTWEYKTISFTGHTATAITNNSAAGLELQYWLASGPDYKSGTHTPNSWTQTTANRVASNQANLASAVNNYWQVTGVQLEVGDKATPFEHLSYADELAKCQRYYWRIVDGNSQSLGTGTYFSSTALGVMLHYPVTMRVAPSKVVGGGTGYFKSWRNGGSDDFNGFTNFYNVGKNTGYLQAESADGVSGTQGHSALVVTNNASAYVDLDAEL